MPRVRHIVLFVIHEQATDEQARDGVLALRRLGDAPGLLEWRIELSQDLRKGRVIVENALFVDQAALTAFRQGPAHRAAANLLAGMADWVVGDYPEGEAPVAVPVAAAVSAALD